MECITYSTELHLSHIHETYSLIMQAEVGVKSPPHPLQDPRSYIRFSTYNKTLLTQILSLFLSDFVPLENILRAY